VKKDESSLAISSSHFTFMKLSSTFSISIMKDLE
jgi:hypothetical protein